MTKVLPALSKLCQERGVFVSFVDLRWGSKFFYCIFVTKEKKFSLLLLPSYCWSIEKW